MFDWFVVLENEFLRLVMVEVGEDNPLRHLFNVELCQLSLATLVLGDLWDDLGALVLTSLGLLVFELVSARTSFRCFDISFDLLTIDDFALRVDDG